MKRPKHLIKYFSLLLLIASCDPKPGDNHGLPPNVEDLTSNHNSKESQRKRAKWEKLANYLGIGTNTLVGPRTEDEAITELENQLTTEPRTLQIDDADALKKYEEALSEVSTNFSRNPQARLCRQVHKIEPLPQQASTLSYEDIRGEQKYVDLLDEKGHHAAKLFRIEYELVDDRIKGGSKGSRRSALMVVPSLSADKKKAPILVYAHGGDKGLVYSEVAGILGDLQRDHIIVAPTYPGEPFCKKEGSKDSSGQITCQAPSELGQETTSKKIESLTYADAVGQSIPWDTDVDELLGVHDCVVRLSRFNDKGGDNLQVARSSEVKGFARELREKVARYPGREDDGEKSLLIGTSRGGLVAGLALAKVGADLWEIFKGDDAQDSGFEYFEKITSSLDQMTGKFGCLGMVSAPTSVMMGRLRLILEYLIHDQVQYMNAKELPGLSQLTKVFEPYINDESLSEEYLKSAALEVRKRDLVFLAPLVMAGLRDWGRSGSFFDRLGAVGFFHGLEDKVVPFEQSQIAFNAFHRFSSHPALLDRVRTGINRDSQGNLSSLRIFLRAFDLTEEGKSLPSWNQHLDRSFQYSESVVPLNLYQRSNKSFRFYAKQNLYDKSLLGADSEASLESILVSLEEKATQEDCRVRQHFNNMGGAVSGDDHYRAEAEAGSQLIRALRSYVMAGHRIGSEPHYDARREKVVSKGEGSKPRDLLHYWVENECRL